MRTPGRDFVQRTAKGIGRAAEHVHTALAFAVAGDEFHVEEHGSVGFDIADHVLAFVPAAEKHHIFHVGVGLGGLLHAGSTVMNAKAPMMMDQNFEPGFRIDLHIKDLNNVVDAAKAVDAPIPLTQSVLEMMKILHHDGDGSCDHSALLKYYQKLTGEVLHH